MLSSSCCSLATPTRGCRFSLYNRVSVGSAAVATTLSYKKNPDANSIRRMQPRVPHRPSYATSTILRHASRSLHRLCKASPLAANQKRNGRKRRNEERKQFHSIGIIIDRSSKLGKAETLISLRSFSQAFLLPPPLNLQRHLSSLLEKGKLHFCPLSLSPFSVL